ncbi:MAG: cobalamin-dependent protein [Pirellulales bacterium]|nr:cobalamin-dependent protein [Pirellulales bacterium]
MKADCLPVVNASDQPHAHHKAGTKARVLLTSVFGPYGRDDQYGSRRLNPMELYHNQVTRTQGAFSLRMFHRSWGLMLIQANIAAPCTLLDFPTLDRFVAELQTRQYDIIGISSIIPNQNKVKKMCELIRQYQPEAEIIVGGHIANIPDLAQKIDADHVVRGEGVRWFRRYLGEDENQPLRHPMISSGIGTRILGVDVSVSEKPGDVAATIIPSVGCPLGCNFCSTSAMFGGKGKWVDFYRTGDELFDVMCQVEREMGVRSFFIMDENFLFHRRRALRLLELMEANEKSWSLDVFSSANVLRSYSIEQLIRLGISWVWMGIEGRDSQYAKLAGADTFELVKHLQSHGIRVLGSTIIALENHTPENIDEAIEHAVRHDTDFHQFMLYTPVPGTPLHKELSEKGLMKNESEFDPSDIHGQAILNYRHPALSDEQTAVIMPRAFNRDFEVNGPSVVRIVRTTLAGWKRHKNHADPCVRGRYAWEARELGTTFSALVAAAKLYYRRRPVMHAKMSALLRELHAEFGWKSRLWSLVGGRWLLGRIRKEEKRLSSGFSHEPPTFYERNEAVADRPELPLCRSTEPPAARPSPVSPVVVADESRETELVGV